MSATREDITAAIAALGDAWSEAVSTLAEATDEDAAEALEDMLSCGWDRHLVSALGEDAHDQKAEDQKEES